jgi:transcriptional regulator with XRE-family HTH domain
VKLLAKPFVLRAPPKVAHCAKVARDARVSLGYLSEVERGQKEASSELLNAICVALGLSLSGVFSDVSAELKSREGVTLTVVDAA